MMISTARYKILFFISGALTFFLILFLLTQFPGGFLFPSLFDVLTRFFSLFSDTTFLTKFFMTILRLFLCLLMAFFFALLLSYLRAIKRETSDFFTPFLIFLKCSPLAILSVYLFLIFGANQGPYFIILSVIFPIMVEAFFTAQDEIPMGIKQELAITNVSTFFKYFQVIFPLMFPYLFMSFIMSFGLGLKVAVMGEYLMQTPRSFGAYIYDIRSNLDIVTLLASLIFCIAFTLILEGISKFFFNILKKNYR